MPNNTTPIAVVGTAHDYNEMGAAALMHRKAVPLFMRTFENDLRRTSTLLIVEGDSYGFNGKGDVFLTKQSPNYQKRLETIF